MTWRESHDAEVFDTGLEPELSARFKLDGRPGPAPRLSSQRAALLVQGALSAAYPAGNQQRTRARGGRRARWVRGAVVAAAGLALAGSAAALYLRYVAPSNPQGEAGAPAPNAPVAASSAQATPTPGEAVPAAQRSQDSRRNAAGDSLDAARATRVPDDLLKRANQLRARGDFAGAERLYARVFEHHPGSLAAYVARVAAASIRLEQLGDARGAQQLLEASLAQRPGGALDLEIHDGLAKAARALGDRARERAALQTLIAEHDGSLAAQHARQRLRELGARHRRR